jgi:hypothetical protein
MKLVVKFSLLIFSESKAAGVAHFFFHTPIGRNTGDSNRWLKVRKYWWSFPLPKNGAENYYIMYMTMIKY